MFDVICSIEKVENSVQQAMLASIREQYKYPLYGVAALIVERKSRRFLTVVERGHTGLPKGKIEDSDCDPELLAKNYTGNWDEAFQEVYNSPRTRMNALIREVEEETGLKISKSDVLEGRQYGFSFFCRRDAWDVATEVYGVYGVAID